MVAGRLAADDALPTEVVLARHFGVGRNTVRHALAELERDGLVRRIRGKGTYVQKRKMPVVPRRTDSLALVMNDTKDPAHATLLQGFEAAGRDLQLHTLVCGTENDVAKQGNVLFHLLDSGVPGVALVPTTDEPTPAFHVRQLQRHGIPVVLCHRDVDDVRAPRIPHSLRRRGPEGGRSISGARAPVRGLLLFPSREGLRGVSRGLARGDASRGRRPDRRKRLCRRFVGPKTWSLKRKRCFMR